MIKVVDMVEDRIQNAILIAIESIVAPKIELAYRSQNASSGRDVKSVTAVYEPREHTGNFTPFENLSERNITLHVLSTNDETRNSIADEVSDMSVPGTHFVRRPHPHHLVTGPTAQTKWIPDFLTGRILTPRNPPSHLHQNLSTQVSQNNNFANCWTNTKKSKLRRL